MKKIRAIISLFAGLSFLISCNDEFMDRVPENTISDGAVWKTPNDLQLYVNNFYNRQDLLLYDSDAGGGCNIGIYTLDRDNGSDTEISRDYNTHMNGQTSLPATGGGWANSDWAALRDINYFFDHYGTAVGNEAEINRYVGEALFFRAIFYFGKVRRFGDVPWYDQLLTPDKTEALHKQRDSRKFVVEKLMEDLDKAVDYLPSRGVDAVWTGRVNKETAMALQARIALYEGTWEKYHAGTAFGVDGSDGTAFIQKAADVTDALIALGTCALDNVGEENGYQKVFNQESYVGSKEVLFWRQYNISLNITNGWSDFSTFGALTGLSKRMVDSYLCADGKTIDESPLYQGDNSLLQVVADRDPRLNQTIYVNDGKHLQFHPNSPGDPYFAYPSFEVSDKLCVTGYQLYKGHIPSENLTGSSGQNAMIYHRYAEVLLINAEAKAELGVLRQEDVDKTINLLRERVEMPDMLLTEVEALTYPNGKEFPALSNVINEIRRERKVELAAEGFRVDDIFRWAAADILIKGYLPKGAKITQWQGLTEEDGATRAFIDAVAGLHSDVEGYIFPYAAQEAVNVTGYNFNPSRDYLRPIPTDQLVLNPNLTQNPGWE